MLGTPSPDASCGRRRITVASPASERCTPARGFAPFPSRGQDRSLRTAQRGAALFLALVALAILTLAGLALVRSVDTGNLIAGNFAFKEATVHAADIGIEAALSDINNTILVAGGPGPDNNLPNGCTAGSTNNTDNCRYFARKHAEYNSGLLPADDKAGLPANIDWSHANLPLTTTVAGYEVRYVIDRLCDPDPAVTVALGPKPTLDQAKHVCYTKPVEPGGSQQVGVLPGVSPTTVEVFYRVTVRVSGPRNSVTWLQTIVGRST